MYQGVCFLMILTHKYHVTLLKPESLFSSRCFQKFSYILSTHVIISWRGRRQFTSWWRGEISPGCVVRLPSISPVSSIIAIATPTTVPSKKSAEKNACCFKCYPLLIPLKYVMYFPSLVVAYFYRARDIFITCI